MCVCVGVGVCCVLVCVLASVLVCCAWRGGRKVSKSVLYVRGENAKGK